MREIKFRAWCKLRKEMLQIQRMSFKKETVMPYGWNLEWDTKEFELMQYTGLKDKNGKEIYEGDIIQSDLGSLFYIEFVKGSYQTNIISIKDKIDLHNVSSLTLKPVECNYIIVGNIYENPELLVNKN